MHNRKPDYLLSVVPNGPEKEQVLPVWRHAYLVADLPKVRLNPDTYFYGHRDLASKKTRLLKILCFTVH